LIARGLFVEHVPKWWNETRPSSGASRFIFWFFQETKAAASERA
jgi:hypothetical protein